jgi:LysM domain.
MAVENQSFKEVSKIESSANRPNHAQTEALQLLTDRRVVPANKQSGNFELSNNIYGNDSFNPLANAGKFDNTIGTCSINKPKCESEKNWRPDAERKTPGAQAWDKQAESQRQKPLERNADGSYTVKQGDSLNDIARRLLKGEGSKNPSQKDVDQASKRLYEANPKLGCNPDLVRPGMELKLPNSEKQSVAKPADHGQRQRVDRPQHHNGEHFQQKRHQQQNGENGERLQPRGQRTRREHSENGITSDVTKNSGVEKRVESSKQSQKDDSKPKSTEQQLDEMRKLLESMKKTMEDMQAKQKSANPSEQQGRRTEQPGTKPPVSQETFSVPGAQTLKWENQQTLPAKSAERLNSAEPRVEEVKPSNSVENAEPRNGWRPRNNGIADKLAARDAEDLLMAQRQFVH